MINKWLELSEEQSPLLKLGLISIGAFTIWYGVETLLLNLFVSSDFTTNKIFNDYFILENKKHIEVKTFLLLLLWPLIVYALRQSKKLSLTSLIGASFVIGFMIDSTTNKNLGVFSIGIYLTLAVIFLYSTKGKLFWTAVPLIAYLAFIIEEKGKLLLSSMYLMTQDALLITFLNIVTYYLPILLFLIWITRLINNGHPITEK